MEPLLLFAYLIFGVYLAVAILFIATSLWEGELRAAFITAGFFAPFAGVFLLAFFVESAWASWLLVGLLCIFTVPVILIIGIRTRNESLRVVDSQPRVDERDAVFHRFLRIQPGTPEYDAYYKMHPEKLEFDKSVSAIPHMDEPGSKSYDPLTSPFMAATMSTIVDISRELEWRPSPLEGQPVAASAEEFSARIKGFGRYLGACHIGCTELNPAYVYANIGRAPGPWGARIDLPHQNAIAVAVPMSHEMVRHAPDTPTCLESGAQYVEVGVIAMTIAKYINLLGYEARAHVDANYRVMCVPIAADAGIGELGRLGLLISPKYGPRIRLAVVTTDLPLKPDPPIAFGVQDFCAFCKKCADICPSGSVDDGDKMVYAGVEKWQTKPDSCYRYWRMVGSDCGLCMKVCPYSHPNNPLHDGVRFMIQRNHMIRRLALLGDDLAYGRKPNTTYRLPKWHQRSAP